MASVSDCLKITIRDRWTHRESSHYCAKLSPVSKNNNSLSYKPLSTSSGEVGEPMGHSHSHTVKVLSLKNAMETLVLLHPLVDSLNQVILFLVFTIFYQLFMSKHLGGNKCDKRGRSEDGGNHCCYFSPWSSEPPPHLRVLPYVPSIRH